MTRFIIVTVSFAVLSLLYRCDKCYNCHATNPQVGQLIVKLSYPGDSLIIYEGGTVGGAIIRAGEVTGSRFDTVLPVNQGYSAKAIYQIGDSTIIAVDGEERIETTTDNEDCDSPCYKIDKAKLKL